MKQWKWIIVLTMIMVVGSVLSTGAANLPKYSTEDVQRLKVELPGGIRYGYVFVGNGTWVIPPRFEDASFSFNSYAGLASVKQDGKYGFIDLRGQVVIPSQFDKVGWSWGDDRMLVEIGDSTGFIDHTGKMVIGLQSGQFTSFGEGLAAVHMEGRTKYINKLGESVFEVEGFGGYFRNGLSPVTLKREGRIATGFIDTTGKLVIEPQNGLFLSSFNEGMAPIRVGNKYGFINVNGAIAIPAEFDGAFMFQEGLASVLIGRKIGFIDLQGKMVLAAQYEYPDDQWQPQIALGYCAFRKGVATVKYNGKFGVIDKNGNWVVNPIYNSTVVFFPRYHTVISGGYYYDLEGKKLDHYVNHILDGEQAIKNGNLVEAAAFFKAALKINPGDEAAAWKLSQAEGRK